MRFRFAGGYRLAEGGKREKRKRNFRGRYPSSWLEAPGAEGTGGGDQ